MNLLACLLIVCCVFASPSSWRGAEYKAADNLFVINSPSRWKEKKSIDPTVVLRLERGARFIEFSKLDSKLGDYYLKSRLKEQIESMRAKGSSVPGDINRFSIRQIANFYYTSYASMGYTMHIGFLTYKDNSYAVSAKGLGSSEIKKLMRTFRLPGEKIVFPKPPRRKVAKRKKRKKIKKGKEKQIEEVIAKIQKSIETSTKTSVLPTVKISSALKKTAVKTKKISRKLPKKKTVPKIKKPLVKRKPLPVFIWIALAGLWLIFMPLAKSRTSSIGNPKIPPPPKDVPPDFFFPFLISRFETSDEILYSITTRQRQKLSGYYFNGHEFYFALTFYGLALMHAFWSFSSFVSPNYFINLLLKLPLGNFLASFPEIVFLLPLFKAFSMRFKAPHLVEVQDALHNTIVKAIKDRRYYAIIRDAKGKEAGALTKTFESGARVWNFTDSDDQIVFTIKDEHPEIYRYRKFLGSLNGNLRSRYSIYAPENRLAGFVLNDPTSKNRFQIHLDYAFSRLSHPSYILGSVLFILSYERDRPYPTLIW